ncbi:MAG: hypothetical protein RL141_625 [Candidatus Parcubacteria bacterium]|jgi:hypothetical protein
MSHSRFLAVITTASLAITILLAGGSVLAQGGFTAEGTGLSEAGTSAGYQVNQPCITAPGGCIPQIVGQLVSGLLGLFGALFLGLIIYGGVQYMLSQGNEEQAKKALNTIRDAVLGLVIVAASYAIAAFVLNTLGGVTGGQTAI